MDSVHIEGLPTLDFVSLQPIIYLLQEPVEESCDITASISQSDPTEYAHNIFIDWQYTYEHV